MSRAAEVAAVFDRVATTYETVGPPFFDHFGALLVSTSGSPQATGWWTWRPGRERVTTPALAATGPTGSLLAMDLSMGGVARLAGLLADTGHRDARAVLGDIADPGSLGHWVRALVPEGRLGVSTSGSGGRRHVRPALRDRRTRRPHPSPRRGPQQVHIVTVSLDLVLADVDELLRWSRIGSGAGSTSSTTTGPQRSTLRWSGAGPATSR